MNLLRYVLDGDSKASLKRVDAHAMDPAALNDVAHQGEFERALALLELLFDAGMKPPKQAELLLDTLFDIWPRITHPFAEWLLSIVESREDHANLELLRFATEETSAQPLLERDID